MNGYTQRCQDVAMKHLKPSASDLARGFELHENAVVFDAYGFGPRASVDAGSLNQAIKAGACSSRIRDQIEAMRMSRHVADADELNEFKMAWQASGVTCVFQNAGQESHAVKTLLKRLAHHTLVTDQLKNIIFKAVQADDVHAAKQSGRHCYCFTTNGVPLAESWASAEAELEFIQVFRRLGVRMMHLTYNRRNLIGDGCAEQSNAGLSDFGRMVIRELNRCGVIPDVAHCGLQTSLEATKASDYPVMASHTACRTLHEHCRGKSDAVIKAIAETDGAIGVCGIPAFLGRTGDIQALLDHIDYLAKIVGTNHIAIGTDRAYVSSRDQRELAKVTLSYPAEEPFENFWKPDDPIGRPEWNHSHQLDSLAWTNWPLFTVGLVQRGFSDIDIKKIIGGNVLRILNATIPVALEEEAFGIGQS